ncbi:MAG: choloylglycine hydrolase [Cellulosilyticaceae bacterium]
MCTALTLTTADGYHLFGRNMDIEYTFNQAPMIVPRNFVYKNKVAGTISRMKYAMIGMGTIINEHPMFAEAMNEKGLGCAGLNFPGYAHWSDTCDMDKINVSPYDIIPWILGQFANIEALKPELEKLCIVNKPINNQVPLPPLHWIVTDREGACIVIEQTIDKLKVYDNQVGILANSPTFDWHITNLHQYMGLSANYPGDVRWGNQTLIPVGQGVGAIGLPGDFSSTSRFVKTAFLRNHMPLSQDVETGISDFFHILGSVAMIKGAVITPEQKNDITQYTSCMCLESGMYYYTTCHNQQINGINMHQEALDAVEIKGFSYQNKQSIYSQK